MDFENKALCVIVAIMLIIFSSIIVISVHNNATIEALVQQGTDPIAAACAIRFNVSNTICTVEAMRK